MTSSKQPQNGKSRSSEGPVDPVFLQNKGFLQDILESTADGILVIGKDDNVLYANHRFSEMWQIPKKVMDSKDDETLLAFILGQIQKPEAFLSKVHQLYGSKKEDLDLINFKDGRIFERFSRLLLRDDEVAGRGWLFRDITERKKAEEALKISEEMQRAIIASSNDCIKTLDLDGNLLFMSEGGQKLLEIDDIEPLLHKSWIDYWKGKDNDEAKKAIKTAKSGGIGYFEGFCPTMKGTPKSWGIIITPIYGKNGKVESLLAVSRDITEQKKAEEALKESEEKFKELYRTALIALFRTSIKDGKPLAANKAAAELFGYSSIEEFKKEFRSEKHYANYEDREPLLKELKEKGKIDKILMHSKKKDGTLIWNEASFLLNPKEGYIDCVSFDVSERKKAERDLEESEDKFRKSFDAVSDMFVITRVKGAQYVFANKAFEIYTGLAQNEIVGKTSLEISIWKDDSDRELMINEFKSKGSVKDFHFALKRKSGEQSIVSMSAWIMELNSEPHIVSIVRDISERKKTEEALKESENRLNIIFESAPDAYYLNDFEGTFIDGNKAAEKLLGYSREELIGKNFVDAGILPMDQVESTFNILAKNINGESSGPDEHTLIRKDGSKVDVEILTHPVKIGGEDRVLGIARDITKRKKAGEELRRLSTAIEQIPTAVGITDLKGDIVYVNPKFTQMTGYNAEELIGNNPRILKSGDTPDEEYHDLWDTIKDKGTWKGKFHNKHKNGSLYWESAQISPIFDEKGEATHYIKVAEDITDRKLIEKSLEKSEKLYRTLIQTTSEGYWRVGPDHITLDVNQSLCNMLGYSRKEMVGRKIFDFFGEDDLKELRKQTSKVPNIKYRTYELPIQKKNGEVLHILFNATTLPMKDGIKQGSFAMITDITKQKELTEKLLSSNKELKESQKATLNILEDLSAENRERKVAEEEKEMEMTRAEFYLDLMGHDITNIHQGIYSWIQLAMHVEKEKDGFELDLKVGENLVNRSIALVKNVQLLSGLKRMNVIFQPFELGASIEKTIEGVEEIFVNKQITFNYEPPAEDIVIQAEPLIEQLFLNLIHNGVKFQYGDKAIIDIDLSASEKERTARFEISDHGPGIPDEMKVHIFDRFKKKDMKFHAGIGLSLVKELVDRYNGEIDVMDRIKGDHKKGARFVVTFPLGEGALDSTIKA